MESTKFLQVAMALLLMICLCVHTGMTAESPVRGVFIAIGATQAPDANQLEALLARRLRQTGYQVLTVKTLADKLALPAASIESAVAARSADLRRMAARADADLIFTAALATDTQRQQMIGMQMEKTVATTVLTYCIIDTASGDALETDSRQFQGSGTTEQSAVRATFKPMVVSIQNLFARQWPPTITLARQQRLALYRRQHDTAATPQPATLPVAAHDSAQRMPGKPSITLVHPPVANRGFKIIQKDQNVTIEGVAEDAKGIVRVMVNDKPVDHFENGRFSVKATLQPGENQFAVLAQNTVGETAAVNFTLNYKQEDVPPAITLNQPLVARGFKIKMPDRSADLKIQGRAIDDSGVAWVKVNGRPIDLDSNGAFQALLAVTDTRQLIIEACDIFDNRSRKSFLLESSHDAARVQAVGLPVLWGLAVGVSQYSSNVADLKYAAEDAVDLANFFRNQAGQLFAEVHFQTLVDRDVSRDRIIEGLTVHLGQAGPEDVVFIFLAGHGVKHPQTQSYYFLPSDADSDNLMSHGMRMTDFDETVRILADSVGKIILAMDTCHAGAMQFSAARAAGGHNLAESLRQSSGIFIISSAKSGEQAKESDKYKVFADDVGHGAFTYAFLQGMLGEANFDGDDHISVSEIFKYVARQVPRLTQGSQHPYLRMAGTDMPLAMVQR